VTEVDHNYDFGTIYHQKNSWSLLAPTNNTPYQYNTGGELELWKYSDKKQEWTLSQSITENSKKNHSYPRRPIHYHSDFQAFWADGHPRQFSEKYFRFLISLQVNILKFKKNEVFKFPFRFNVLQFWAESSSNRQKHFGRCHSLICRRNKPFEKRSLEALSAKTCRMGSKTSSKTH
jgi:hypothetical protein